MADAPNVLKWSYPRTMHFGPHTILLAMERDLRDDLTLLEAEETTRRLEEQIMQQQEETKQVLPEITSLESSVDKSEV